MEVDAASPMSAALVAGLAAGLGIALPVGAVATYLVSLAARTSLGVAVCAALGVATADGLYALTAVLGGAELAPVVRSNETPLRWASAVVLVALASRMAVKGVRQFRAHRTHSIEDVPVGAVRAYLGLLGLTMLSPVTVVYFAALVLAGRGTSAFDDREMLVFAVSAFAGSAGWQLVLACGGALLGRVVTGSRGRLLTSLLSSAMIVVFTVHLVLR